MLKQLERRGEIEAKKEVVSGEKKKRQVKRKKMSKQSKKKKGNKYLSHSPGQCIL